MDKKKGYNYTDADGQEHRVTQPLKDEVVDLYGTKTIRTLIMEADGTHYALTVIPVLATHNRYIGDAPAPQILVVGGVGRKAYCFKAHGWVHPSYVAEKLDCTLCDAANLVHMLEQAGYRQPI